MMSEFDLKENRLSCYYRSYYTSFCPFHVNCMFMIVINIRVQTVDYEEGSADDDSLREMVEHAVQRLYDAMNPVMWGRPRGNSPPILHPHPPLLPPLGLKECRPSYKTSQTLVPFKRIVFISTFSFISICSRWETVICTDGYRPLKTISRPHRALNIVHTQTRPVLRVKRVYCTERRPSQGETTDARRGSSAPVSTSVLLTFTEYQKHCTHTEVTQISPPSQVIRIYWQWNHMHV